MVKLTIGGGTEEKKEYKKLPPMRGVTLFLQSAELLPKDETYEDRIKWVFEVVGGPDVPDDIVGETHWVFTNMPQGKSGKVSLKSNLYEILEGVSGGEFEPEDEIDTDDYVGRNYTGDFKRVPAMTKTGEGWVPQVEDGKPVKKIKLVNLFPVREEPKTRASAQRGYNWGDDEDDDEAA